MQSESPTSDLMNLTDDSTTTATTTTTDFPTSSMIIAHLSERIQEISLHLSLPLTAEDDDDATKESNDELSDDVVDNPLSVPLTNVVEPTVPYELIRDIFAEVQLFGEDDEEMQQQQNESLEEGAGTELCNCSEVGGDHHHHHHATGSTTAATTDFTRDDETKRRHEFVLVEWKQVPPYLQNNPFILKYYRTFFSYKLCWKSLFRWHNETVNIWSHLIGAILFIIFSLYTIQFSIINYRRVHIVDVLVMLIYNGFAVNCFLSSTMYHMFGCHSKKTWGICYRCDVSAISGLIGGSFLPALYFTLKCERTWQIVYIVSIMIFAALGMLFPFLPIHRNPLAIRIFRISRTLLLLVMVLASVIPFAHWLVKMMPKHGGFSHADIVLMAGCGTIMVLYGLGLLFWLTKIPERFAPGWFDLLGHSHQIWHLFIVTASTIWFCFMNSIWNSKMSTTC